MRARMKKLTERGMGRSPSKKAKSRPCANDSKNTLIMCFSKPLTSFFNENGMKGIEIRKLNVLCFPPLTT
jgi:hypothetical protein